MSELKKHCCDRFASECSKTQSFSGGGFLYPPEIHPSGQIEYSDGWHVNGCCGGGCYVLTDIKFCPFCGSELAQEKNNE